MASPNPRMQALLDQFAAARAGQPSRYEMPFPQARVQLLEEREPWLDDGPACEVVQRHAEFSGRRIRVQTVRPPNAGPERLLVYFHGGGWCVGSPETHGPIVRRLAEALACNAWSIDYALAPEAPFPNGLSDCEAAIELAQSEHPDAQLIVAGDSAGANLAIAATLRLRNRALALPHALLLFYGVYTDDCGGASMDMYGDGGYGLSIEAHRRYMQAYVGAAQLSSADARYVFPLRVNADLRGLPPCYLLAAQVDILRDQSHEFAAALRAAQVETAIDEAPGVTHGFLSYGKALPEVGAALQRAARFAATG